MGDELVVELDELAISIVHLWGVTNQVVLLELALALVLIQVLKDNSGSAASALRLGHFPNLVHNQNPHYHHLKHITIVPERETKLKRV